eukprot:15265045-Ditylum_brightwellii.AAC.1
MKATKNTNKTTAMLMDYLWTYPEACLHFFVGDIQLYGDSDAAYLVMTDAKSCIAETFYCTSKPNPHNYMTALHNTPILVKCKVLKNVLCSAAEAECRDLFHNGQTVMGICNVLEAMGNKQGPMHVKTDNKIANSFVHTSIYVRRSKSWDMRWHWLHKTST